MPDLGQLLVFEGADAVGKTTISRAVTVALTSAGRRCMWYAFPGREESTIGALVYRLHHEPKALNVNRLTAGSLQALHIAAHLDAIESVILPNLRGGTTLILDRFWWSTWVYGVTSGIEAPVLRALIQAEKAAWGQILPSAAFYVARERPLSTQEGVSWTALKLGYEKLIEEEKRSYPIHVIANQATVEDAVRTISALL